MLKYDIMCRWGCDIISNFIFEKCDSVNAKKNSTE